MSLRLTGNNLVGQSFSEKGQGTFCAIDPRNNELLDPPFFVADVEVTYKALEKAQLAFSKLQSKSGIEISHFLSTVRNELISNKSTIISRYLLESGLSEERAQNEFSRTVLQLEQFIELTRDNHWREVSIDRLFNSEGRVTMDLRKMNIGIGPVLVFGASNFPLAYSTAGTDTISALAAGCPVIVKAHPYHPGTSELVAQCIRNAIEVCGFPDGTFSHLIDDGFEVAKQLVLDTRVKAVGFTGSESGGRAIFNLAASRPDPIPVFAEMGSTNPIIILPDQLLEKSDEWTELIAHSVTNDAGQFCTKPGILFCLSSPAREEFMNHLESLISHKSEMIMVHPNLVKNYKDKVAKWRFHQNPNDPSDNDCKIDAFVFRCSAKQFLENSQLREEVFGPFTLLVSVDSKEELSNCLNVLNGQLTGSVFGSIDELREFSAELEILREKVGRVIINGVPTGVTVRPSMQHGGPYPASTDSRFTSVGIDSIKRFVRPQSFQNWPNEILPLPLRNENPLKLNRRVDGNWSFTEIKP